MAKRKTTPTCARASRSQPCWGAVADGTCAGHFFVGTGGRYVPQGDRHAFESRIERMRAQGVEVAPEAAKPAPKASRGRKAAKTRGRASSSSEVHQNTED